MDKEKKIKVLFSLLLLLLFLEIYLPAINKSLWYDDLDGLYFGRLEMQNAGQVDEEYLYPLDQHMFSASGRSRVYQKAWVYLNAFVDSSGLSHSLWRLINISFFVLALALISWKRLKGYWRLLPCFLALFSDHVWITAITVRNYNLAALFFVLCFLLRKSQRQKLFYLSMVLLWQCNIVGFIVFSLMHWIQLIDENRKASALFKKIRPCLLFYCVLIAIQFFYSYDFIMGGSQKLSVSADLITRSTAFFLTFNAHLIPALLWPFIFYLHRSRREHGGLLYLSLALIIVLLCFSSLRPAYLIIFTPVILLELSVFIQNRPRIIAGALVLVLSFTHLLSLPFNGNLPRQEGRFYDNVTTSQKVIRTAPLDAVHRMRHRKWLRRDAVNAYVGEHYSAGDSLLYSNARLSVVALLYRQYDLPVTGYFPKEHAFSKAHPASPLSQVKTPFWAFPPNRGEDIEKNEQALKEYLEELKKYGEVEVHRIPKRSQDWVLNKDFPPPELSPEGSRLVFYVTESKNREVEE